MYSYRPDGSRRGNSRVGRAKRLGTGSTTVDANEIERYSEVGESGDGPGSMCDAVSLIASRLSEEYEQHTCLEAATTVLAEFTGWTAIVLDVDGRLIAGSTVTEPPVLEPAMIASTSPSNVDGWICLALP